MAEDRFVEEALAAAKDVLRPPLSVRRGASLLYQVTVDNRLRVRVDPARPTRGQSAFQIDLCVFETVLDSVEIPRVVIEFKPRLTTHDVLTYSAKARKHKQVYPYLRYGIVLGDIEAIPARFFRHNEALDFCVAASTYRAHRLHEVFANLLRSEVAASRRLERMAFERTGALVFRNEPLLESLGAPVV